MLVGSKGLYSPSTRRELKGQPHGCSDLGQRYDEDASLKRQDRYWRFAVDSGTTDWEIKEDICRERVGGLGASLSGERGE